MTAAKPSNHSGSIPQNQLCLWHATTPCDAQPTLFCSGLCGHQVTCSSFTPPSQPQAAEHQESNKRQTCRSGSNPPSLHSTPPCLDLEQQLSPPFR